MAYRTIQEVHEALLGLGSEIRKGREAQGWTRKELAQKLGIGESERGTARVSDWEDGRIEPRHRECVRLASLLDLSTVTLNALLQEVHAARGKLVEYETRIREANGWAIGRDYSLLAQHVELLLSHVHSVLAWKVWHNIRIANARVELAFLGGCPMTLGTLVKAWRNGIMVLPNPDGRDYFVISASGSPLSPSYRLVGFDEHTKLVSYDRQHDRSTLIEFVSPVYQIVYEMPVGMTAWSLGQLVCRLGAEVDDIVVKDDKGSPMAEYCHEDACLTFVDGRKIEFPGVFLAHGDGDEDTRSLPWEPLEGPVKRRGEWTVGPIPPLMQGAWQTGGLEIPMDSGSFWTGHPGWMSDEGGRIQATYDGILPAPVLQILARTLAREYDERDT